jgi:hypothetical protein
MPFSSQYERAIHFERHGRLLRAATELEYEQMADALMFNPMTLAMRECIRPDGIDRLRFDVSNDHFGAAIVQTPTLKTFYMVTAFMIRVRGGKKAFFDYECARTDV